MSSDVAKWIDEELLHEHRLHVGELRRELDLPPLEGRIVDDPVTPGRYGRALIAGVEFAVEGIELKLGAVIFECVLMWAARYPFTVRPGSPVKIWGRDEGLVADYAVPGISDGFSICEVRKGDMVTIFLPLRFAEISSASPEDRQRFNNMAVGNDL